jgi:thiosulfate/3-mercaptopyruvate sulfurtransferase
MSTILSTLAVLVAAAPGLLVSPAELAAALEDPATVVIATGNSVDDFTAGHIPNARLVLYDEIAIEANGLQSELPPVDRLRKVLAAAGISDSSKVVIYGSPIPATRLFFTLDYLGHTNVRVLNGGLNAWKAAGGALEVAPPKAAAAASLSPKPDASRVVSADWITQRLSSGKMTLLDARPDAEFTGADGGMGGAHVKGHLPDAQQLVWNTLLDSSGKFLPDAELRKKFEAIGAKPGTPLVSYCMIGMRASVTYFVARHLGYDARLYDGSIADWTRRKLPAVMGPQKAQKAQN